jgi:hypothetical protein
VIARWFGVPLLLAAGVLASPPIGELPVNEPRRRGEWLVLDGDFHVHTRFSDGFLSPIDVVIDAQRKALDVIAITEHNMVLPAKIGRWFAERFDGPLVLVGEEITTNQQHLIAVGLERAVAGDTPLRDAIREVHAQGGVAIAAHPVQRFWSKFEPVQAELDGLEVVHPIALRESGSSGWRWGEMIEFYETTKKTHANIAAIGSSDFHFFGALGVCRTHLFVRERSAKAVLEAIKNGRTVTFGPDGRAFGDRELVALLEREPLPARNVGPGYPPESMFDALARTLVWLALVGLVLIRPRAKPQS